MAIQVRGQTWIGSEAADIEPFLNAFPPEEMAYRMSAFRLVRCGCGAERFQLVRAGEITQATCAACGLVRYISRDGDPEDWQEAAEEEELEPFSCEGCQGTEANAGVGFAGYEENPRLDGVQWFYLGVRCARCGVLEFFNEGKVGYGPAVDAYRQVTGAAPTDA
jgi:hypothetical protein